MCSIRSLRMRTLSWHTGSGAMLYRALGRIAVASLLLGICDFTRSFAQSVSISSSASIAALGEISVELESEAPAPRSTGDTLATLPPLIAGPGPRLRPQNLGARVNTAGTELGPVIAPDGRTLYFTRGGSGGNQDIWFSQVDSAGEWKAAQPMPAPLTNPFNNFVESVTPDGNTLLVGGRYLAVNSFVTGLAVSHRTRTGWSLPEPLRIRNYYSRSRSVSSCLGSDGGTLVMSLDRLGGSGRQDLYVSFRESNGEWSEPQSLGPAVNSADVDFAPFLAADGVTLYFASKGHHGYGDADIFVTRRLDSTWEHWSVPENLGPTINSPKWDAYYVIPASGEHVYFGSVENAIGESDLMRAPLPAKVRPKAVALVSGRVLNSATNEPVDAMIHYSRHPDGADAGTARTDPSTGSYAIALPAGGVYTFRAEAPEMLGVATEIDLTALDRYDERQQDLALVPFEDGHIFGMPNLFFDFGQSTLRVESFPELDRLAELMEDNPTLEIEVSGHTDHIGSAERNARLSQERVASVVAYITASGIAEARLHTVPFGESHPVADNFSDEGRQRNRRVELRIVKR